MDSRKDAFLASDNRDPVFHSRNHIPRIRWEIHMVPGKIRFGIRCVFAHSSRYSAGDEDAVFINRNKSLSKGTVFFRFNSCRGKKHSIFLANLIKHLRRMQISHKNISAIIFAANKNQASSTSAYIRVSQEGRATISIDVLEYTH